MNIKFPSAGQFWNWLVVSSSDPNAVSLTVKGFFSLSVVQTLFSSLGYFGVHPAFTLDMLGADAATIIYSVLTAVSYAVTAYGVFRKWIVYFHDLAPKPPVTPAA